MIRITGRPGPVITLVAFAINLVIFAWTLYLIVKVAAHVGAWPFA